MRIRCSRRALRQLDEALAHIAADNPRAAASMARRVESLLHLIARHPTIGRPTTLEGIRVFRTAPYPYLIFYQVEPSEDRLTALRIGHTAREQHWREGH